MVEAYVPAVDLHKLSMMMKHPFSNLIDIIHILVNLLVFLSCGIKDIGWFMIQYGPQKL